MLCKCCCSEEKVMSAYYAFMHSKLPYGVIFWGYTILAEHTFTVQKRATRIIKGAAPRGSCSKIFRIFLTIPLIHSYESLCFLKCYPQFFSLNGDFHQYETRNRYDFYRG